MGKPLLSASYSPPSPGIDPSSPGQQFFIAEEEYPLPAAAVLYDPVAMDFFVRNAFLQNFPLARVDSPTGFRVYAVCDRGKVTGKFETEFAVGISVAPLVV